MKRKIGNFQEARPILVDFRIPTWTPVKFLQIKEANIFDVVSVWCCNTNNATLIYMKILVNHCRRSHFFYSCLLVYGYDRVALQMVSSLCTSPPCVLYSTLKCSQSLIQSQLSAWTWQCRQTSRRRPRELHCLPLLECCCSGCGFAPSFFSWDKLTFSPGTNLLCS